MLKHSAPAVNTKPKRWLYSPKAGATIAVALLWLCLVVPVSANAEGQALVADSNCGEFVDVLPMDAEANPYAGQYEAWDVWVFENAVNPESTERDQATDEVSQPGHEILRINVTPEGFAVPIRVYFNELYSPDSQEITNCPYYLTAEGTVPPTLRNELVKMAAQLRAASLPEIPAWLVGDLPLWALILPSGEVVTMGELGSGTGLLPGLPSKEFEAEGEAFFSFDADGGLLGQTGVGEAWWKLFFVDFDEKLKGFNSNTITYQELNGFIIFQDPANISVFELYDFRGNEVTDTNQVFDPKNRLAWIDGGNIPLVFEAQANCETD